MMTMLCLIGLYLIVRKLKGLWSMACGNPATLMHWMGMARRALGR